MESNERESKGAFVQDRLTIWVQLNKPHVAEVPLDDDISNCRHNNEYLNHNRA
jgi:hypothetical protein